MSEFNYAGAAFRENLKRNPDLFGHIGPDGELSETFTKQLAASAKERHALDAKNHAARTTLPDLRKEYNQLRQRLFNLKQDAKSLEQKCNDAAGNIRLFEQRIQDTLKLKQAANEVGNLRGVRTYESAVQSLEVEVVSAQSNFDNNKRWSGQAARALRDFDGHARIEELKALLDAPLPEPKK